MDVMTANTAHLDFHSYETNKTAVNYDRRIQCATSMGFATIDDLVSYAAPLSNAAFTTKSQILIYTIHYGSG